MHPGFRFLRSYLLEKTLKNSDTPQNENRSIRHEKGFVTWLIPD
jgi:hypothetical protein